jgi:hypothetical protein
MKNGSRSWLIGEELRLITEVPGGRTTMSAPTPCNGFGFGGAAFHRVALVTVVSYDRIRFGCTPFLGQDYCSLGVLA